MGAKRARLTNHAHLDENEVSSFLMKCFIKGKCTGLCLLSYL